MEERWNKPEWDTEESLEIAEEAIWDTEAEGGEEAAGEPEADFADMSEIESAIAADMETEEERQRKLRRRQRIEEMQRAKQKAMIRQKILLSAGVAAALLLGVGITVGAVHGHVSGEEIQESGENTQGQGAAAQGLGAPGFSDGSPMDEILAGNVGGDPEGSSGGNSEGGVSGDPEGSSGGNSEGGVSGDPEGSTGGNPASSTDGSPEGNADGNPAGNGGGNPEGSAGGSSVGNGGGNPGGSPAVAGEPEAYGPYLTDIPWSSGYKAESTDATEYFGEEIISRYGVLIDVEAGTILAQRDAKTRMNPASMTKILTVLTAATELGLTGEDWESMEILDDKFKMTIEITDYCYVNDCSNVGFDVDEELTLRDLFYGTILPSGGDAAMGLAYYVAGSQEAFVELMNKKLEEMGLSETSHFTNCVGLYDENHYCTVYDMAVMMKAATDIPFCRAVLSAHTYQTSLTEQHPEGLLISNWFLRRIEDKDTHGEVLCGKTGFVDESGSCAASLARDHAGREYLCVTAASNSSWRCIYDQVELFQKYLPEAGG